MTPTDPILSSSTITGKVAQENLAEEIRHTLSAESGANDGLAYLFVLLPILILTRSPMEALQHWLTKTLLWEVGGAVLLGALFGYDQKLADEAKGCQRSVRFDRDGQLIVLLELLMGIPY